MNIKLGEIFSLQMGKTPSRSEKKYWSNGKYDWVSIADLSRYETYVESTKEKISQKAVDESGMKLVPPNTVIMSFKLSIGKTAITRENTYTNEAIMAFIPRKSELVCPSYFFHLFRGLNWDKVSNRAVMGSTLNKSSLSQISISLPLVEEQKRIARLFDSINTIIVNCKKQLTKLDELVKSRFIELFGNPVENNLGWKKSSLSKLTFKIGSGATPRGGRAAYIKNGISLVRSMNVYDGLFVYDNLAFISDEQARKLDNVVVEKDDIFLNITGASVARSCIVPINVLPARVNQHVAILRCNQSLINCIFLNNLLLNVQFKNKLLAIGESNGATREAITKKQLEDLEIILPPISLQLQFSEFVNQVDKSKLFSEMGCAA